MKLLLAVATVALAGVAPALGVAQTTATSDYSSGVPLVICGQTLGLFGIPPAPENVFATQRVVPRRVTVGDGLLLQLSPDCATGGDLSLRPSSVMDVVRTAKSADGGIAAALVDVKRPGTVELVARRGTQTRRLKIDARYGGRVCRHPDFTSRDKPLFALDPGRTRLVVAHSRHSLRLVLTLDCDHGVRHLAVRGARHLTGFSADGGAFGVLLRRRHAGTIEVRGVLASGRRLHVDVVVR